MDLRYWDDEKKETRLIFYSVKYTETKSGYIVGAASKRIKDWFYDNDIEFHLIEADPNNWEEDVKMFKKAGNPHYDTPRLEVGDRLFVGEDQIIDYRNRFIIEQGLRQ